MMKYKIGDRVKVRSDLTSSKLYDGYGVVDKMIRKREKIVTITVVHVDYYEINEDTFCWTDQMFEGLAEDELTAEEAIILYSKMCGSRVCEKCKLDEENNETGFACRKFMREHPDKVIEVLKDYKKKEIETEIVDLIKIMKEVCDDETCIYAYEIDVNKENINEKMKELVKKYSNEQNGKIYAKYERICRAKC